MWSTIVTSGGDKPAWTCIQLWSQGPCYWPSLPGGLRRENYRRPSLTKPPAQFNPILLLCSLGTWALTLPQKDWMRLSIPQNPVCHPVSRFSTCAPVLGYAGQMERGLTFQALTVRTPAPFSGRGCFPKEVSGRWQCKVCLKFSSQQLVSSNTLGRGTALSLRLAI